ncbi:putative serine/threonine-protein phosphatase with EF-hands [Plasmopara halstedii]
MGAANGTQFRLVNATVELQRETRDFARWTLADVEQLHRRFNKTFGFSITASQFENLLLCQMPESVGVEEIFEALDVNHDGRVDGLELLAALACVCRAEFEDKARFTFDLFDFNHNGSLSLVELAFLMKSVSIGMALLTGVTTNSEDVMKLCLELAKNAFSQVDDEASMLGFDDFIAWARQNREFMLQVEHFRIIAAKSMEFEDALSLPEGSDYDSDLEVEEFEISAQRQNAAEPKPVKCSAPWTEEPLSPPSPTDTAYVSETIGMPPSANLRLEWVYGTGGPSVRNACRFVATGEAVYFVGSYAVLYLCERHEQRYYRGHRCAIGCLAVNASGELVATGDASCNNVGAEVHVWSAKSLQCLAALRNFHPTGIAHVFFPAAASATTATLPQSQSLMRGERSSVLGKSAVVLSCHIRKKKSHETDVLLASIGSDTSASMALWNWQEGAVVASGRAQRNIHSKMGRSGSSRPLACALNEDGDEIVVVGAHFINFYHVHGQFFKQKKPHWHGIMEPGMQTVPVCLSVVYYGLQSVVVGTGRGELLLFDRHTLTRSIQAHEPLTSVNVCFLSCHSMVLFTAGKDGQIKQWDSTLHSIGHALNLHTSLPISSSFKSSIIQPGNALESDDLRICSLDYDAQRRRFLVATRMGNIFELDDKVDASATPPIVVATGHKGPTRSIAAAITVGGIFASCGMNERSVKIWSLRRRTLLQHLCFPGASEIPSALAFSSDGECLAIGSEDGMVLLARRTNGISRIHMTTEALMKNTNAAIRTMRFGPLETDPLLAVARANGLIYLYRFESEGPKFSRYMLLHFQTQDITAGSEDTYAHALDFSVDGGFLRAQYGSSMLCIWDLRKRAGTRVTSRSILQMIRWQTHSVSIGWDVGGLSLNAGDCAVANSKLRLILVLSSNGDINLAPFPCPPSTTANVTRWLTRRIVNAHLTSHVPRTEPSCSRPLVFGDFALRGNVVITSSQYDAAICQWRVHKELADVQPHPPCQYDQLLCKRLRALHLKEIYFPINTRDEKRQQNLQRYSNRDMLHAVKSHESHEGIIQRSEAPDLALTLSFVYGFNHRNMSVNQSLACLGNGLFVYGAGSLLIVSHVHAIGTRQRIVTTGLKDSVSCIVKHSFEPILAVGSRRDEQVLLLRVEEMLAPGKGDFYHQLATLDSHFLPSNGKNVLIAVDFSNAKDSRRNIQSDLVAAIWKCTLSHVHTLAFYAWKRQLVIAYTSMTRQPVLFGRFVGYSETGAAFVSGGIDHVTFWSLESGTGYVSAQQGIFGRHAVVRTITCAVYVAPFVITGVEDGSIVLWENNVAAYTARSSSTMDGNGVVALEHIPASRVVLEALRNGSLAVWRYTTSQRWTKGAIESRSQIRASTFLKLTRVVSVLDGKSNDTHVCGMSLLDDGAIACFDLSTDEIVSVDLDSILDDKAPEVPGLTIPPKVSNKGKEVLNFSPEIIDIALHPRDFLWASASADGRVSVWSLRATTLLQQQSVRSPPRSLAWSSTGEHLAVSLSNGKVFIFHGTTLEKVLEFTCGDPENASANSNWCSILKYSPAFSHNGSAVSRSWLALACRDFVIYVYAWESTESSPPSLTLQHNFVGHTAPIEALDFSFDCRFLQSATSSNTMQLMRWPLQNDLSLKEEKLDGTAVEWTLSDNAWVSWTVTFAGPTERLAEYCGVDMVAAIARINSDTLNKGDFDGAVNTNMWESPLPTMVIGLDNGQVMLAWYPLTCEDVMASASHDQLSSEAVAVTKKCLGCFSRESTILRIGFSFTNAFVVALARDSYGSTQVAVWKTDYDDEVRLRQRFALKTNATSTMGFNRPDRILFEQRFQAQQTKRPISRHFPDRKESNHERHVRPQVQSSGNGNMYLEYVYGVNTSATGSCNVFYADDAWEIVYTAGVCGVVYNTKTQTQLINYETGYKEHRVISALAVHPKGNLVASGECLARACGVSQAPQIIIWDANSGITVLRVLSEHYPGILLLRFSPEGHRLASIGMELDHTLAIYAISGSEIQGGRLCATLLVTCKTSSRRVWSLSFGDDEDLAVCGDQHILFWQQGKTSSSGEETCSKGLKSGLLTSHKECDPHASLLQVVHMAGRARVVVSSQADGSIYFWKDRVCVLVRRDAHGNTAVPALAVDHKHSLLYSAGDDGRICAWNAQLELVRIVVDIAKLNIGPLPLSSTNIQSICVRDEHVLFTTAQSEVCELLPVQQKTQGSSENEWRLNVHVRGHANAEVSSLAAHPCKSAQFASAGDDGTVRLWDATTRSLLASYQWCGAVESTMGAGRDQRLRALAFSSDGKYIAVGTDIGVVRVLTAALDSIVTQWSCWQDQHQSHAILALQYSNDGKLLVVASQDGTIHTYDATSYRRIMRVRGSTLNLNTIQLDFARNKPILRVQYNGLQLQYWQLGSWEELSFVQVQDAHWESMRYPSLINNTMNEDFDGTVLVEGTSISLVKNWAVTKNEMYLLSSAGVDGVMYQFRLLPRSTTVRYSTK